MKLQDCKTLAEIEHAVCSDVCLNWRMGLQRAAEIGGEKVKEAAQQAVKETDLKFVYRINDAIRTLDVKQIIEGE